MQKSVLCVCGLLAGVPFGAAQADPTGGQVPPGTPSSAAQLRELKRELKRLRAQGAAEQKAIEALESRVSALGPQGAPAPESSTAAPAPSAPASPPADDHRRRAPAQSASSAAVYGEQGALFTRHLTLEPKFTYTYYDRNQINLNGFLALSSIFLGNISVQKVKATTLQFDLLAREGLTPRLQVALDLPFLYRSFEFISGGAGGSASTLSDDRVDSRPFVQGDITFGAYYQLAKETASHPNVVWNVQAIAPTGIAPYGIKVVQPNPNNTSLLVPSSLPTGNGLWGLQTGLSFVKSSDPAILFGSLGIVHYFPKHFSDISNTAGTVVPGVVALGDVYQLGVGMAFALNRQMSFSVGYSQSVSGRARTKADGADWSPVVGSDANAALLNFGVTYGLSDTETVVTSLGIGMTKDAPDVTLSVAVPYTF